MQELSKSVTLLRLYGVFQVDLKIGVCTNEKVEELGSPLGCQFFCRAMYHLSIPAYRFVCNKRGITPFFSLTTSPSTPSQSCAQPGGEGLAARLTVPLTQIQDSYSMSLY